MKAVLIAASIVLTLVACHRQQAPLYDLAGTVPSSDGEPYSLVEVKNAILRAGARRGWAMHEETPGLIVATLDVRSHRASININYDQWGYRLNYSDSSNLNYDGANIHPNYNKWIRKLNMAIQSELNSLPHSSLSSPANQSLNGVLELKPSTA